ncbi:protein FAM172A isoform X2 [Lingula anatina]|uniref:Protein FAM172A isoform X2 n=1 Tax=Lingula anatina TaxID=7574 RepID=A0A1S3HGN2_LINAN|nr:protein FAM172A isoform X2 [Lingula anatina]|eukprot:XP_013385243.1 protein FAM172A isoform X2 [Lingula anatina]
MLRRMNVWMCCISKDTSTEEEEYKFPKKLEDFEYTFNDEGYLEHIETKESFIFKVRDDHFFNQRRYEALGEVITEYVYNLLEKAGLEKVYVPVDAKEEDEPRSFFFMSKDALTNPDKLLILIHGSGVVRAGQWARRLIINDCLNSGTQLPFIKKAMQDGHGIIVLNTNENTAVWKDGIETMIRGNDSPEMHALYVWDHFVSKAAAKHIAIIAHSYGGIVTVCLTKEKEEEVLQRVYAIAFTDSVHSLKHQEASEKVEEFYMQNAKNWVSSDQPLDAEMPNYGRKDCPRVSAGTQRHEETSWNSMNSIFKFLDEKLPSTGTGTNEKAKTEL